ncbi:MAG: hypothetical protein BIFFINMI_03138 [Phycisphaerae bacterium]|nr:hypothetical protein [Phycisphaerae bacterium]
MRKLFRWFWAKRLRRWGLIAGVGLVLLSVGTVELTSQSWFCNSCHIMNTYYASWKTSPHKDVECIRCHIAPGMNNFVSAKLNGLGQVVDDVLHRTSTKPSASVSDMSCTRAGCHEQAVVQANDYTAVTAAAMSATQTPPRAYFFDHSKHLGREYRGISIHCSTCHSHVQGDQHFEVNTNVCVTCHLFSGPGTAPQWSAPVLSVTTTRPDAAPSSQAEQITGSTVASPDQAVAAPSRCKNCHEPPKQPVNYHGLQVIHDEYLAYGAACESCHRNVTAAFATIGDTQCYACHDFGAERIGDIEDLHRVHTVGEHKVECFSCHGLTAHGPKAAASALQLEQLTCGACHKGQHQIQQTTYKPGVEPTPTQPEQGHAQPEQSVAVSPMFMAHVDCTGCHVRQQPLEFKPDTGATVAMAAPQACDACHKPGLGASQIALWQKATKALYEQAAALLPATPPAPGSESARLVAEARKLLDLVRLDGSWGVHNPKYTESLLLEAIAKLRQASAGGGS